MTLGIATESGQLPSADDAGLPTLDAEATEPADKWWSHDGSTVHLELHEWSGDEDIWVAC
ncbi:hypothetical protein [Streptomyces sp. NBC_01483]|uniref:hypothetical protein n=1 Tax=Streptomyces sp. NBC_01483 TaxID=2903883 RepID=UPI002E32171B|nr:hypothetical protein [Streptomyces sp. NBC_01483]